MAASLQLVAMALGVQELPLWLAEAQTLVGLLVGAPWDGDGQEGLGVRFPGASEPLSSMWAQQQWPRTAAEKFSAANWMGTQTDRRKK